MEFDEHMNTNIKIFESYPNDEKKTSRKWYYEWKIELIIYNAIKK